MLNKKSILGFSLLEMLAVLAIVVILLAMAGPDFKSLMAKHRAKMAILQLSQAIQLAKNEAIKRNSIVTLCGSQDGQQCDAVWSCGCLVFVGDYTHSVISPASRMIQFFKSPAGKGRLTWRGFSDKAYLQFNALGFAEVQNGTFLYCSASRDPHQAKALWVSQSGRMTISEDDDHDGIDEDSKGRPLNCVGSPA